MSFIISKQLLQTLSKDLPIFKSKAVYVELRLFSHKSWSSGRLFFDLKKVTQGNEYQKFFLNKKFFIPSLLEKNIQHFNVKFCFVP